MKESNIKKYCQINTNGNGVTFVGVKANKDGIKVYFPLGYALSDNDNEIRKEICNLLHILAEFTTPNERQLLSSCIENPSVGNFPLNAYMNIIEYYLRHNGQYYIETEIQYKKAGGGKQNWARTFKHHKPFIQNINGRNNFVYTTYDVKAVTPNSDKFITEINRYCVNEAFKKLGWLYVSFVPKYYGSIPDIKIAIAFLQKELNFTFNDEKRNLFLSMKNLLEYTESNSCIKDFNFGTNNFEIVWERLIDKAFGIHHKEKYLTPASWILKSDTKTVHPLIPDSIMLYNDKCYILDAKYYKYGITANPDDLPGSSSILKQIAYGDYAKQKHKYVFNAFIMPFNSKNNPHQTNNIIENIGTATGEWVNTTEWQPHKEIQGILIDTKYLMNHFRGKQLTEKQLLAKKIEKQV